MLPATLLLPTLIKALTTALLVVLASALAEALGPFWGALVASLPVSAGPAYVFLSMQHTGDFIAASALSSAAANAATGLFLIVYAMLARRVSLWPGLGVAVAAWLVASLALRQVDWTPATVTLLNLAVYGSGFVLCRRMEHPTIGPATIGPSTIGRANIGPATIDPSTIDPSTIGPATIGPSTIGPSTIGPSTIDPATICPATICPLGARRRNRFDLPVRAIAVALFVSAVVLASAMLGAEATGIAAVFPISLISLIVILRPRVGGAASAVLAASALRAMLGFGLMLLALHLAIPPWGTDKALVAALLVSLAWSAALLALRRRSPTG
jgi:hypothetical protein